MDKLGSKTIIGAGASFNGKIINARVIEINGKMNADLTADKVTIGEAGHFDGAIRADLVVVSGHYEGKMQAGSVWATATASISGELNYESLQMDRGAALNCHVVHNWTAKNTAAAQIGNDDVDLLIPTTSNKKKNGPVPASPEGGA
jgi:cytoskeletal protein CcmA (bactofilin family)